MIEFHSHAMKYDVLSAVSDVAQVLHVKAETSWLYNEVNDRSLLKEFSAVARGKKELWRMRIYMLCCSSLRRHLGWSKKLDKLSSELATYWNYGGSSLNHHKIFHRTMKLSNSRHMWKILVFFLPHIVLSFDYKFHFEAASTKFIWLREEVERVCSSCSNVS